MNVFSAGALKAPQVWMSTSPAPTSLAISNDAPSKRHRESNGLLVERSADIANIVLSSEVAWSPDHEDYFWSSVNTARLCKLIRDLADDASVAAVAFDMHSPGGTVYGLSDLIGAVKYAKARKRVHAIAHDQCTSLTYVMMALAHTASATPSAVVGGLGAGALLVDSSAAYEKQGLRAVPLVIGELKTAGMPGVEVTPEIEANLRAVFKGQFDAYLEALAARGIGRAKVVELNGGVFCASDALAHGLIDRIETHEAFLARVHAESRMPRDVGNSPKAKARSTNMTIDELKASHPDVYAAVVAESKKEPANPQPATFQELHAAFGTKEGGKEFIVDALASGCTLAASHAMWATQLEARMSETAKRCAELEASHAKAGDAARASPPNFIASGGVRPLAPAAPAILEDPAARMTFIELCAKTVADEKVSHERAVELVAARHKDKYEQMRGASQRMRGAAAARN